MNLFDEVAKAIAQDKSFAEVFTTEIVDRLAELSDAQYDVFKVQLEAHLILSGTEMDGLKNLDKLVRAARARLDEKRSKLSPVSLGEQMPDAPHADRALFVPPGWLLASDGIYRTDAEGIPKLRICTCPVYVAEKRIDFERRKAHLTLAIKTGEWRITIVSAPFAGKKIASVVADLGALVLDDKEFSQYWSDLLRVNFDTLPTKESDSALYEDLVNFISDNFDKVSEDGSWGKLVNSKEGPCLALKPQVVRKFARVAGVDYEHLLTFLREKGLLLSDGNSRLKTVWFNGRARRMVAVVWKQADQPQAEQSTATKIDKPGT